MKPFKIESTLINRDAVLSIGFFAHDRGFDAIRFSSSFSDAILDGVSWVVFGGK